ncbi:unnamed protein product [Ixodes hexagonus]
MPSQLWFRCAACTKACATLRGLRVHTALKKHGPQDGSLRVPSDNVSVSACTSVRRLDTNISDAMCATSAPDTVLPSSSFPSTSSLTDRSSRIPCVREPNVAPASAISSHGDENSRTPPVREVSVLSSASSLRVGNSRTPCARESSLVLASAVGDVHDVAPREPVFSRCPRCSRAFSSVRGMSQHQRHAHAASYNEAVKVERVKPR